MTQEEPGCIFCRIARGELPARKVHEDDHVLAFHDVRPLAPEHILIIPKRHVASLMECEDAELLGRMLAIAGPVARQHGCADGFRTIINTGRVGGQEVYHLHAHILGGQERLPRMLSRD